MNTPQPAYDVLKGHPESYNTTTNTPWGPAQYAYKYAPGVISYGTAGHGGFHLSTTLNQRIHPAMRQCDGWYEEDCEWSFVAITFPWLFKLEHQRVAHECAMNWFPHQYEAATGYRPTLAESMTLRDEEFDRVHALDYISVAAWGSWADWVPEGKVGVLATVGGGRHSSGGVDPSAGRYYLVPAELYEAREGRYVIDHEVAEECDGPESQQQTKEVRLVRG